MTSRHLPGFLFFGATAVWYYYYYYYYFCYFN